KLAGPLSRPKIDRQRRDMLDTMKVIDRARAGDHYGTLGDERPRDGEADPFARACDDADFTCEFEIHPPDQLLSRPGIPSVAPLLAGSCRTLPNMAHDRLEKRALRPWANTNILAKRLAR